MYVVRDDNIKGTSFGFLLSPRRRSKSKESLVDLLLCLQTTTSRTSSISVKVAGAGTDVVIAV